MGNICSNSVGSVVEPCYNKLLELNIKEKDWKGQKKVVETLNLHLSPPVLQDTLLTVDSNLSVKITGCLFQGKDPKEELLKPCQDNFAIVQRGPHILSLVFDGHGREGQQVADFCKTFMTSYFEKNHMFFGIKPELTIKQMFESCYKKLSTSEIDCTLSGTTAVAVYLKENQITVGHVGDSRAVLGTLPNKKVIYRPYKPQPYKRYIPLTKVLSAVALTTDHKPNFPEENRRIAKCGGIVAKCVSEEGREEGPYRVWAKGKNYPGLAMSRSIGDTVAFDIGVVPEPVVSQKELHPGTDQFIVIASDGVWDVMSNFEVVNFVEKFKKACKKEGGNSYPAKPENSSIARLLCEEARYRWMRIVEEEDGLIDDISAVVIEIGYTLHLN